jgi:hypothetical protein
MNNLLPTNFNWKEYIILNEDLRYIDDENEAIKHYLNYGIKENRVYSIIPNDFNWKEYIRLNKDLISIDNENEAIKHYLNYGIKEKRIYKTNKLENNKIINDNKTIIKKKSNMNYDNICKDFNNDNNSNYDFLDENQVLYTRCFLKNNKNYLKYNIDVNILDSLLHFVLVVDFNNGGGGTTVFLNRIVSKYKNFCTFLIVRVDGLKYYLNINEEYLNEEEYLLDNQILMEYIDIVKKNRLEMFYTYIAIQGKQKIYKNALMPYW